MKIAYVKGPMNTVGFYYVHIAILHFKTWGSGAVYAASSHFLATPNGSSLYLPDSPPPLPRLTVRQRLPSVAGAFPAPNALAVHRDVAVRASTNTEVQCR